MLNRKFLFLLLACCLLAFVAVGCDDDDDDNGDGGNGGNGGGGVGTTGLNGDAGGSFIQNAEVAVLTVGGDIVATTTTDNTGGYTVTIPDDQEGPFLLRVQGTAGQSQLVTVNPDGTTTPQDFLGPWYSVVTTDDLLSEAPQVNTTPLTTIAVWMLRTEAAKAGQIDEALLEDYGSMVENMAANAFMAGLQTDEQSFAAFSPYTSPVLPKGELSDTDANELLANRAASAIAKDVLSNVDTPVQVGSSAFAGNLALFGVDLSDGVVDGQVEGFSDEDLPSLESLLTEAVALFPSNGTATDPGAVMASISDRFAAYTGSDIQSAVTGLDLTLTAEANTFGTTPPAFSVPVVAVDSTLMANPPAQMILILNPAVVVIPEGQATNPTATSTLNFVVLDGKGADVTGDYLEKLSASVISNGNVSYLPASVTPTPVLGGVGYEVVTDPFVNLGLNTDDPADDNTATATVTILGTSLQSQTMDGEDLLITFVQAGGTPVATAIDSSSLLISEADNLGTMTIDMATSVPGPALSGVATLTVDNGWFWTGSIDNVSKSLMGQAFVDGVPFDVGYLSPDNVTGTTANVKVDLEDNNNITGLARTPVGGDGVIIP